MKKFLLEYKSRMGFKSIFLVLVLTGGVFMGFSIVSDSANADFSSSYIGTRKLAEAAPFTYDREVYLNTAPWREDGLISGDYNASASYYPGNIVEICSMATFFPPEENNNLVTFSVSDSTASELSIIDNGNPGVSYITESVDSFRWQYIDSPEFHNVGDYVTDFPVGQELNLFGSPVVYFGYFCYLIEVPNIPSGNYNVVTHISSNSQIGATDTDLTATITVIGVEPTIELSDLPARESRVYKDFEVNSGEEYSFRFKVDVTGSTGIPRFSFLGADGTPEERHEAEWNQNTKYVEVKINSRGGGGAPDEEKTLVIQHAGATSKEVKFDLDNQAPSLVSPSDPDSNLYKIINLADPHIINDYVTSVSGSATLNRQQMT